MKNSSRPAPCYIVSIVYIFKNYFSFQICRVRYRVVDDIIIIVMAMTII
jgi:hypothetical protein